MEWESNQKRVNTMGIPLQKKIVIDQMQSKVLGGVLSTSTGAMSKTVLNDNLKLIININP